MNTSIKKSILGQYFTKQEVSKNLVNLFFKYHNYEKDINILEPSSGTGSFIKSLEKKKYNNITSIELDHNLTEDPIDFFDYSLVNKFDVIIGNPPFSKYNIEESYYHKKYYKENEYLEYLNKDLLKLNKIKIENAFILKSIKHLRDKKSSIGFVLPISFFIAKKNNEIKKSILDNFSTVIIYQNDEVWFDENISCCFAIFTNIKKYDNKIILIHNNKELIIPIELLMKEELIPKTYMFKNESVNDGKLLSEFLESHIVKYKKSYTENNINAANIKNNVKIKKDIKNIEDICLCVVRVGNSSIGKSGLINNKTDILNDMFYVFKFKEKYNGNIKIKEKICKYLNDNTSYFKNSVNRVGSKSLKKTDILNYRIEI